MTQEEALSILKLGVNVFLTGEPGSGKTHTINRYIAWLRERGVEPSVTASTGIAATHVNGMTIHSWSGIGVKKRLNDWDVEQIASREKTAHRIIDAKVLIVDEISMLDGGTLESVDKVLRTLRIRPMMPEQPFGGLQVIFVGDFFQLPPVSRGEMARFAFDSASWREANPVVCYLSEQHRQEDGAFLGLLDAVRRGDVEDEHYELLQSRMKKPGKEVATRLHTHNAEADRINDDSLAKVEGKMKVFEMTSRGAKTLVDALKQNCLSPETLRLKEGASVMFTRNNFEQGYANGTLGTVISFANSGLPIVRTKRGEVTVEEAMWEMMDGNKILAKITQIPLRLAWAITVHKSQGMSLDAAIIDLSRAFEFGQGYVALSRVRSLEGLYLEGFNNRALIMHPTIVEQDRIFRSKSEAAKRRIQSIEREEREMLEKNFLKAVGAKELAPAANSAQRRAPSSGSNSPRSEFAAGAGSSVLRGKYPNMGKPWNKNDDTLLSAMFSEKKKNADIAKHFGRKPSAIRARLGHLGLIPDFWKVRREKK
ncbi:AAA family ATPase [Candidatus Kaiserbacteria bacterium]|nr:AAA family ATPase [Candidatus Kaiserbacteria bacterium]